MDCLNPELYSEYYRLGTSTDAEPNVKYLFTLECSKNLSNRVALATATISKKIFQSEFQQITSFLTKSLEDFLKNTTRTRKECVYFYCNLYEWNRKIEKYNKKIDNSKFLNRLERILSIVWLSLKCKPLDLSGLNQHIWELELTEKSRNQREAPQSILTQISQSILTQISQSTLIQKCRKLWTPPQAEPTWSTWMATHQHNYVAHAINIESVDKVFAIGKVVPSEQIFLENGSVNHEGSFYEDHKQITTTLLHPEIILTISQIKEKQFDFEEILTTGTQQGIYSSTNYHQLRSCAEQQYRSTGLFPDLFLFAHQRSSITSLDRRLSKIFKQTTLADDPEKERLKDRISQLRYELFPLCKWKILDRVCCTYNRIAWEYGPVVVLRGKPRQIATCPERGGVVASAVQLLAPFENNGEYFGLDLLQEDTYILGPKTLLEKYQRKYGSRIHYIEDLTPLEKDLFQVDLLAHVKKQRGFR